MTEGPPKQMAVKDKSGYWSSAAFALVGLLAIGAPIENPALANEVRQFLNILLPTSWSISAFIFLAQQLKDAPNGFTLGGEKTKKTFNPPTSS
ncbi:MAG: hypothetical protein AAB662_03405 [Patescibacteria group bacterium]